MRMWPSSIKHLHIWHLERPESALPTQKRMPNQHLHRRCNVNAHPSFLVNLDTYKYNCIPLSTSYILDTTKQATSSEEDKSQSYQLLIKPQSTMRKSPGSGNFGAECL